MFACRGKTYQLMDKRVSVMGEIISGMRIIKMYCWEKLYGNIVHYIRKQEVSDSLLGETIWVHCGCHHKTMLGKCKWNIEICERWKTHLTVSYVTDDIMCYLHLHILFVSYVTTMNSVMNCWHYNSLAVKAAMYHPRICCCITRTLPVWWQVINCCSAHSIYLNWGTVVCSKGMYFSLYNTAPYSHK